jgi:hypothetical protein
LNGHKTPLPATIASLPEALLSIRSEIADQDEVTKTINVKINGLEQSVRKRATDMADCIAEVHQAREVMEVLDERLQAVEKEGDCCKDAIRRITKLETRVGKLESGASEMGSGDETAPSFKSSERAAIRQYEPPAQPPRAATSSTAFTAIVQRKQNQTIRSNSPSSVADDMEWTPTVMPKEHALPIVEETRAPKGNIANPSETNFAKFNPNSIAMFSGEGGSVSVTAWVFMIERGLRMANSRVQDASWVALTRSQGAANKFIQVKMLDNGSEMDLPPWEVLRPALLQRFGNYNPETLRRIWSSIVCKGGNGRAAPSPGDIEAYWDDFQDALNKIKLGTIKEHHPSIAEINRQFLKGFPCWMEELSRWMTEHSTEGLDQLKEQAKKFAEAHERVAGLSIEKRPEMVAAVDNPRREGREESRPRREGREETRPRNEGAYPREPRPKGNEREQKVFTCWRCAKDPEPGKYCRCKEEPKCTKCGGLHLARFHQEAKDHYLRVCKMQNKNPYSYYDCSPEQNSGWWEFEVKRRAIKEEKARNARANNK